MTGPFVQETNRVVLNKGIVMVINNVVKDLYVDTTIVDSSIPRHIPLQIVVYQLKKVGFDKKETTIALKVLNLEKLYQI